MNARVTRCTVGAELSSASCDEVHLADDTNSKFCMPCALVGHAICALV